MLPIVFAAILAGGLICTVEFVFIVLTCGPFWMGPGVFFLAWLIYSVTAFIGFCLLNSILYIIPVTRKFVRSSPKRFLIYFVLGWIVGGAALVILMARDFKIALNYNR